MIEEVLVNVRYLSYVILASTKYGLVIYKKQK